MKTGIQLVLAIFFLGIGDLVICFKDHSVRYDDYKVYSLTPSTTDQVRILQKYEKAGLDFWNGPARIGKKSDVMISPLLQNNFISDMTATGLGLTEFIPDVQMLIDNETMVGTTRQSGEMDVKRYNPWNVIYKFLQQQADKYPDTVKLVDYGKSGEGRPLKVISISKSGQTKPAILIEAGIHAREWIAPAVTLYIINEVLNGNDDRIQAWLNDFDLYVSVLVNVDGYAFTHSRDRMWRKTRSKTNKRSCMGADPNRNWPHKWMEEGTSKDSCSESFGGAKPYSENETKALAKFVDTISSRLVFYFALHSYGNYFLIPYAYSREHFPFYNEYLDVATKAAEALARRYGTKFRAGTLDETIQYVASGGSIDTIKNKYDTKLVLGAELRGGRGNGFLLPASEIEPSSLELIDAIHVFLDYLRRS